MLLNSRAGDFSLGWTGFVPGDAVADEGLDFNLVTAKSPSVTFYSILGIALGTVKMFSC